MRYGNLTLFFSEQYTTINMLFLLFFPLYFCDYYNSKAETFSLFFREMYYGITIPVLSTPDKKRHPLFSPHTSFASSSFSFSYSFFSLFCFVLFFSESTVIFLIWWRQEWPVGGSMLKPRLFLHSGIFDVMRGSRVVQAIEESTDWTAEMFGERVCGSVSCFLHLE